MLNYKQKKLYSEGKGDSREKCQPGELFLFVFLFVPMLMRLLSLASHFGPGLPVGTLCQMQFHASKVVLLIYPLLLSIL